MRQLLIATPLFGLFVGVAAAQSPAKPDRPPGEMVQWLTSALPANKKQTSAEEEKGRRVGRDLPMPEILRPILDRSLPAYQPRKDIKLSGNLNGACSDTMPALVRLWIETFRKYYPDVNIDVPPPYDGNLGARELVKGNIDFAIIIRQRVLSYNGKLQCRHARSLSSPDSICHPH